MKRWAFLLAVVLLFSGHAWAQAGTAPSQVMITLAPKEDSWVGQKVTLGIDLLAPGYFSGTPRFDYPQIPGVLLIPPEDHPVVGSRQIDGQSYTVQHYDVLLFAKRSGPHEIPSFKIRFEIKRDPTNPQTEAQEVLTPSISFNAKLPPGAEKLTQLVSATDLTMQEQWQPKPHANKVGDALTRQISYQASDVSGMAFPPFPTPPVDGIGIYRKSPTVSDQSERGTLMGHRQEVITYVCERPGHFTIPAVRLTWWNTTDQALKTIELPEEVFDVVPNPSLSEAVPTAQATALSRREIVRWACGLILGMVMVVGAYHFVAWRKVLLLFSFVLPTHLSPLNPGESSLPRD